MRKLRILLFAADAREPRLFLDEDIRQIREAIRLSRYHRRIEIDVRPAARVDDLLQALNDVRPHVVHFSGHGWSEGLELVAADGYGAQLVDVEFLTGLFRQFRGNIRLVLFNACASETHARAVAEVVGCAIGMRGEVDDQAAIIFDRAFYRAIGFRCPVDAAFEQGRLAAGASPEREIPYLAVREDVDATRLVLLPPPWSRGAKRAFAALAVAGVVAAAAAVYRPDETPPCAWDRNGLPALASDDMPRRVASNPADASPESELDIGRALQTAGDDDSAVRHFEKAAREGNTEAIGFLGVAYLCGKGTSRHAKHGVSLLREAAGKRDERAMIALAFAYQHGIGVKRNRGWMRHWYRLAAGAGHSPEAMRRFGAAYADEVKWDSAAVWYRRAVRAGSADAMADLASVYEDGPPALRDSAHARALLDSAQRAGSVRAAAAGSGAAAAQR